MYQACISLSPPNHMAWMRLWVALTGPSSFFILHSAFAPRWLQGRIRVASGWLWGAYRLPTRWLPGGLQVASTGFSAFFILPSAFAGRGYGWLREPRKTRITRIGTDFVVHHSAARPHQKTCSVLRL